MLLLQHVDLPPSGGVLYPLKRTPGIRVGYRKSVPRWGDGETGPLKTWRPMMKRALTQIRTVTLIASLAFIKVGQQIIYWPL